MNFALQETATKVSALYIHFFFRTALEFLKVCAPAASRQCSLKCIKRKSKKITKEMEIYVYIKCMLPEKV